MIGKLRLTLTVAALVMLFFSTLSLAQKAESTNKNTPSQRIKTAPESVFNMFREAGMKPANHNLTSAKKEKVSNAFALLPPYISEF